MRKINKGKNKFIIGLTIGLIIASCGVYATTITGSNITYSNTTSGLSSINVQGAIDELYEKAKSHCPDNHICSLLRKVRDKNPNIIKAYLYDEKNSNTKCMTGDESTCKETNCINYSNQNHCPAGTIIKYRINSSTIKKFHVMFDEGNTMTMQSQEEIVYSTTWNSTSDITKGPITILTDLENETKGWSNVNNQTYTLGTTSLSGEGAYTGCNEYNSCTTNSYTLSERTAKARLITVQEATALGCSNEKNSCPRWLNSSNSYWTSTVHNSSPSSVYYINHNLFNNIYYITTTKQLPAHAVIEIAK